MNKVALGVATALAAASLSANASLNLNLDNEVDATVILEVCLLLFLKGIISLTSL